MTNEEFLKDVCPNHTETSKWNKSELLNILDLHKEQLIIGGVSGSFSANKEYDKLFKDLYKEDKREGSVYPSLNNPEAVYHGGKWLNYRYR